MTVFQAGVQYNDFKGSVAADRSDTKRFQDFLKEEGLSKEGELLVGVRVVFNENDANDIEKPGVVAYLLEADEFIETPDMVRAVEVDLPIAKFFSFYKRFDLVMTNGAMDFENTKVDGPHWD